ITICLGGEEPQTKTLRLVNSVKASPSVRVTKAKVEINLTQVQKGHWDALEDNEPPVAEPHMYPTSGTHSGQRDWDEEVAADPDCEEKPEGVMEFLSSVYANADPDAKRAMMKSFQESGGTVLSTNWSEVGKGKVAPQPPGASTSNAEGIGRGE
ncbi:hypothetical protein KIPB_009119, partial [Kipferlia bialata]